LFLKLESKETKKEIQNDLERTIKYGAANNTIMAIEDIIQFTEKSVKILKVK